MKRINEIWTELEKELSSSLDPNRKAGVLTRLATPDARQRLRVGIEWPSKCRVLLFDTAKDSLPPKHTWPACHGLEVSLGKSGDGSDSLLLRLREKQLEDVFAILAEDLARKIADSKPDESGLRVLACLARWQKFLSDARRGFSEEASRGLWGELWALEHLVATAIGVEHAVMAWRGPFGAPQDFQFAEISFEIKTRAAKPPAKVTISSEFQLYAEPWTHLFLGYLAVDEQASAGETLPQRIASVRKILEESPMREPFEDALLELGWLESYAENHSTRGFQLRSHEYFEVSEDFPCIVPARLPEGIGRVTYDLALDGLKAFQVSASELVKTLNAANTP